MRYINLLLTLTLTLTLTYHAGLRGERRGFASRVNLLFSTGRHFVEHISGRIFNFTSAMRQPPQAWTIHSTAPQ